MKILSILSALALTAALASCDREAALYKEVAGTWAGTPETFSDPAAYSSTITETLVFTPDATGTAKTKSGPLEIAGMVSTSTQMVGTGDALQTPLTLSAAAETSVKGTWTVIDDDEIAIHLNPATISVQIDPTAVELTTNILTGTDTPRLDSLRPAAALNMTAAIKQALTARYASIHRLDDVKVKGPILKFEIDDRDCVFTRQD